MAYDAEKEALDCAARTGHERLVRSGERRIPDRGSNGELISYRPEEYGASKVALRG